MLRPDEPQAASSMVGSTHFIILAASAAMRPYSGGVFAPICQGPSISLPRHQNLHAVRLLPAVRAAQVGQRGAARMVAVLDQVARGVRPARAEVDREHRLDAGRPAPVDELVGAERVGLGRQPGEVEPPRPALARADAVLPVVARDEVAAGVAHDRRRQLAHQRQHVAAEAALVGVRMARARRCRRRRSGRDARRTRRTAGGRSCRWPGRDRAGLSRYARATLRVLEHCRQRRGLHLSRPAERSCSTQPSSG